MLLLVSMLAATTPSAHRISVGAVGCLCLVTTTPPPDDSDFGLTAVAGGRLQYDYTFGPGVFLGAAVGGETVFRDSGAWRSAVWNGAGVLGVRAGDRTSGGLRFALGAASDFGEDAASGIYLDLEGELAHRTSDKLEVFLDLAFVNYRRLTYRTQTQYTSAWSYGSYVLPLMATFGVRVRL